MMDTIKTKDSDQLGTTAREINKQSRKERLGSTSKANDKDQHHYNGHWEEL